MKSCRSDTNPVYTTLITGVNVPYNQGFRPKIPANVMELLQGYGKRRVIKQGKRTTSMQTVFRDSEAQTDPYAPPIRKHYGPGLEVLTLSSLSWNSGLPARMQEVVGIERARQKKAWLQALPPPFNAAASEMQRVIIEAMELNEWNHREIELNAISSIRLDLARKCMEERVAANKIKYENRIFNYVTIKSEETKTALQKVRLQLKRNLRKLHYAHNNINKRYHKWNVVQELNDRTSEMFAPQLRFGQHPRRKHEYIPKRFRYWNLYSTGDILTQKLSAIEEPLEIVGFDFIQHSKPQSHVKQLCQHETRWTLYELENLNLAAKIYRYNLRKTMHKKKHCSMRKKIVQTNVQLAPPAVTGIPDEEEEEYQATLTLQKIIKGRAIQAVMFEGRVRCQELIDELKSTHALQKCMEDVRKEARHAIHIQQRNAEIKSLEEMRKNEILHSLEGKTVAEILDFLSKELLRIQNEKQTHAIALMADRERHEREAAEGGRRQKEIERKQELEEIWKQICKVYQNSLDFVVEDVFFMMRKNFSEEEARKEAIEYAKRIDLAAAEAQLRKNQLEEEEIIADLIYNFALPEAEKEMVRARLKQKQKCLLVTCHDEIYSQIEMAVKGKRSPSGKLLPMPRIKSKKKEKKSYVAYFELNRAGESSDSSEELSGSIFSSSLSGLVQEPDDYWSTGFTTKQVLINESQTGK